MKTEALVDKITKRLWPIADGLNDAQIAVTLGTRDSAGEKIVEVLGPELVALKSIVAEAVQRTVMEKCLAYIETAWFNKDGMLIAVDGKDFLDDVRNTLIEELGKK